MIIWKIKSGLRDAFQFREELSMTREQRLAYESRLKQVMDEEAFQSRMKRLKREAEQTRKEAEQTRKKAEQKIKDAERSKETIARRLLEKGMDIEFVAESTSLTKYKVIEIQRVLQND